MMALVKELQSQLVEMEEPRWEEEECNRNSHYKSWDTYGTTLQAGSQ